MTLEFFTIAIRIEKAYEKDNVTQGGSIMIMIMHIYSYDQYQSLGRWNPTIFNDKCAVRTQHYTILI